MAAKIRADYEQLAQIAGVFGQQAEMTQGLLAALKEQVELLQGGDWVGKGADAFYQEMNASILPTVSRLAAAMKEAAGATQKMSRVMKQAEQDAAALFRIDGSAQATGQSQASSAGAPGSTSGFVGGGAAGAGSGGATGTPAGSRSRTGAASDPRAEKIQPLLDEGRHLKEMYDDTVREKQKRQGKLDEARRLKKSQQEILRLKADVTAMEHAEKFYEQDMAAKYNEAIALTIQLYKIDVSAVNGKPEYWDGMLVSGLTFPDRTITIGPGGVALSPGWLASTLGHEALHAKQYKENRSYDEDDNPQGNAMIEIEGYHWELANAAKNGLTQDEIDKIKRICQEDYYNKLSPENQKRVNRGIYKPV